MELVNAINKAFAPVFHHIGGALLLVAFVTFAVLYIRARREALKD